MDEQVKPCKLKRFAISKVEIQTISTDEVLRRLTNAGFNVRSSEGIQYSDASGEMVYTQGGGCRCPKHAAQDDQPETQTESFLPGKTMGQKYEEVLKMYAIVLKQRNDLQEERDKLKTERDDFKDENERLVAINQQYQARVSDLEISVCRQNSKEARLNFTALKGEVPILWIKVTKGKMDAMQFNRLRDGLCRMCPDIKLILMTEGTADLYELEDRDLEKMGLARIVGTVPEKAIPTPDLVAIEDKSERAQG